MLQLSLVNFRKGSYILVEGHPKNDKFFIIRQGRVCIFSENKKPNEEPQFFGPGDFVGVIPCMSNHAQIETVIAVTDVECICVSREQYPDLIKQNTPVALKIIRTFANRMRTLNETLVQATLKNVGSQTAEQIFSVASYYDSIRMSDIAIFAYYQYIKECQGGPNFENAKQRFLALRNGCHAVYFESNNDLVRNYPKNTMIMSENQSGFDMFIIQNGRVKITKIVDGNEVVLAILKKGDMFGEMALLENKPRSASAIAEEPCTLMVVNKQNFNQMVVTQPQLISRLTTTLAERLFVMERQLENSQINEPLEKMLDMLSLQIEKLRVMDKRFQTDFTPVEIANMCGLNKHEINMTLPEFTDSPLIRLVDGKIFITDCEELMKKASFSRKKKNVKKANQ